MWAQPWRDLLFPNAEQDEGFRREIRRLSARGLRVVGLMMSVLAAVMLPVRLFLIDEYPILPIRAAQNIALLGLGLAALLSPHVTGRHSAPRLHALLIGVVAALTLIGSSLLLVRYDPRAADLLPSQMTMLMLVGVAAIPFLPWQVLVFGLSLAALYLAAAFSAEPWFGVPAVPDFSFALTLFLLAVVATGLSALLYAQRYATYRAHQDALRTAEDLQAAQGRALQAENAALMERLAAALSHELNNPLGAMLSGVDTLLLLAGRMASSKPEDQPRLVKLQGELRRSVQESAARLKQLVTRMQRFTNLDKAETQLADINEIVRDVVALMNSEIQGRAEVDLDLQPVPPLVCRPQQINAVMGNLLGNAVESLNGKGLVHIRTRCLGGKLEICIQDNGRGLDPDVLPNIFDPSFRVTAGRVGTGNWSLFSARQILRTHGGDIAIQSQKGAGTTVTVTLPCNAENGGLVLPT